MPESAIRAEGVFKRYGKNTVLNDINLDIKEGEFVCLLGPSGCGKSTLLRLIAGLDTPSQGKIYLKGKDATWLPPAKRNFGIMFQSYALFPNLTAFENVAYGLRNHKLANKAVNDIVNRYFTMVGLAEAKERYPAQLSGGEQQRVALARALATNPSFLLLDEPLSALDAKVRVKLRREICRIQRELSLTTIMVTHDQDEALTMADRIVVMNRAMVMQAGTPQEIYEKPESRFVADFIGAINFYPESAQTGKLGSDGVAAVRPENICLETEHQEDSVTAELSSMEFRGSFCRLTARLTGLQRSGELMIDMPYSQVKQKNLQVGSVVYLNMPQQQVLHFSEQGA